MSTEHAAEPVTEPAAEHAAVARARDIVVTYADVQNQHGSAYALGVVCSRLEALVAEYDRLERDRGHLVDVNAELLRRLETGQ